MCAAHLVQHAFEIHRTVERFFFADSPEAIVYLGHWSTAREGNSRKKLRHLPAVRILLTSELTVTRPSSKVFQRFDKENWCEAVCSPTLESCYSSIGNWSLDLGVMGQSVSRPVGSRQTTASAVLRLVKLWAEPLISATILHLFFFLFFFFHLLLLCVPVSLRTVGEADRSV